MLSRRVGAAAALLILAAALASAVVAAPLDASPHVVQKLAQPFSPAADDPATLGDPGSPEDDLDAALAQLASTPDVASATAARKLALDILEGNPLAGKAYSGIPLLNWNLPAKAQTVPAGGNVTVREVRFGDHAISDTALLDFADPSKPFTITYRVAELGPSASGVLAPAPLLAGTGRQSAVLPLVLPELATGTRVPNRFHPNGAPEHTRLAVQDVNVQMPAPQGLEAILDPGLAPGPGFLATLHAASAERLAAAKNDFGFAGSAPTAAEKLAAIGRIGDRAPEKLLWADLRALEPTAPGFLDAAHALGAQDEPLVAEMRTRRQIPSGVQTDPSADVAVVLLNDEAYVSRRSVRLAAGAPLTVSVTNADGFTHAFDALALTDRTPTVGALDWGAFNWRTSASQHLAPGDTTTVTLAPGAGAFSLWLGDPDGGDQAGLMLDLDHAPREQSLRFSPDWAHPNHDAVDAQGNVWVTLGGVDTIARVRPAADLQASSVDEFPLPNGDQSFATGGALGPHDIGVDGRGIVWTTLFDGNGIARLDPSQGNDIHVYALAPCAKCAAPFPVEPGLQRPPSRGPEQLATLDDGHGNELVWFTESNANAIGVIRVAADGREVGSAFDIPCECSTPKGIALAGDGSIWFTEQAGNRLGRLTFDNGRLDLNAAHIQHYAIPTATTVQSPGLPDVSTSSPHSVAVDPLGRVWFTEEETARLAYLDPATVGITELALPPNDFHEQAAPADLAVDPDGTIFFADEYGDAIGTATASGFDRYRRPTARQSQTDEPAIDADGNLWFVESGANLLTRIDGAATPAPVPAPPPLYTADTSAHAVTGSGLRDVATVDVDVLRSGAVVAQAHGVTVTGGAFATRPPALQAGDVVQLTLHGSHPQAARSFEIADLRAAVAHDGSLHGTARAHGRALSDTVRIDLANRPIDAQIDGSGGGFSVPSAGLDQAASGSLSWIGATAAGLFRTVTSFGQGPAPAPTVAPPAAASVPAATAAPPAAPTATALPPAVVPLGTPPPHAPTWLRGRRVAFLGGSAAQASAARLRYAGLELRLANGRVSGFTLRGRGLPVGAGSPARRVPYVLPGATFDRAAHAYRAVVGNASIVIRIVSKRVASVVAEVVRRSPAVAGNPPAAERALALVSFPWQTLSYRIRFAAPVDGVRAQTDTTAHTIVVFLRPDDPPQRVAHDIAHELGHAYDAARLTDADRAEYLRRRGVPDAPWFPAAPGADYDTGAGDFAEVFALCYAPSPEFRSTLASRPGEPCALVSGLGGKG
jgi:streptogramin lyase